jgi:hypothetical protein
MLIVLFLFLMSLISSVSADQRIRVPIVLDNIAAQDQTSGIRTFNVTASTGNTSIAGSLGVSGVANMNGGLNSIAATNLSSTLTVSGAATIYDDFTVRADNGNHLFTVAKNNGTTTIAGDTLLSSGADLTVTGTATFYGGITAQGGITLNSANFSLGDSFSVTTTSSLNGVVALQNNVVFGTKILTDASVSTTRDLLQITLPNIDNYIGLVDVTYIGDMANTDGIVSDLEIFSVKYLVSRMDKTQTATIARIAESYYNAAGGMSEPADTASLYAKSLGCDYNHAKSWVPNARTITLKYLPPTQRLRKDISATVLYEIRSGGPAGNPSVGLSGLWAR